MLPDAKDEDPWMCSDRVVHLDVDVEEYYQLNKQLGRGGCGVIYQAAPKATVGCGARSGKEYCAKVVYLEDEEQPSILHMLTQEEAQEDMTHLCQEINALRVCHHPNIIAIADAFFTERRITIIMELAAGGDFSQRLIEALEAGMPLSEVDVAHAVSGACCAITYLHGNGIVHRDMKPDNLTYSAKHSDAVIKLVDFGLAYHQADASEACQIVGTRQYMAPEMLPAVNGSRKRTVLPYGKEIDMWAVGVTTYLAVFRGFPFPESGWQADKDAIAGKWAFPEVADDKHPVTAEMVSDDVRLFIHACLEPDKGCRVAAESALKHCWLKVPDGRLVSL